MSQSSTDGQGIAGGVVRLLVGRPRQPTPRDERRKAVVRRVTVSVSILLLLLVGIPLIVFGALMWSYAEREPVTPMALAGAMWALSALVIGSPFCIAAVYLAAKCKPWRAQQPPSAEPANNEWVPPGKHLCPNCRCRVTDGSKTCRWCEAEQD